MEFDIVSLGDYLPNPITGRYSETQAERFHLWVDLAIRAEELGFKAAWLGEHHCSDYIISSPQMILAAIAARTSRIRLGTAVSLLPNNDPVRLAEDFATLDLLSNGRAEIGFGSGITEHTFHLFGQDVSTAGERANENLDLLLALWNQEKIDWNGRFRSPIHDSRLEPRTFSGRALPINRATATSVATARNAGLAGFRLMVLANVTGFAGARPLVQAYREAYQEAGHDPEGMSVAAPGYVFVRKDGDEARHSIEPYMTNYSAFVMALTQSKGATPSLREAMKNIQPGMVASSDVELFGSPEEVCRKIRQADAEIGGLDRLMCYFDFGGLSRSDAFSSMELFASDVKPLMQGEIESAARDCHA